MRFFLKKMENEQISEKISLNNGEILEIIDKSRIIASDTWFVSLIFRIEINIIGKTINPVTPVSIADIRKKLGDTVVYSVTHERNFIKDNQKDAVLNDMRDSFLNTNLKYLSNPEFSEKFILKTYYEKKTY